MLINNNFFYDSSVNQTRFLFLIDSDRGQNVYNYYLYTNKIKYLATKNLRCG